MSERKLFGTDGIRGKANIYPMTCEVAMALGRAVTTYFQRKQGVGARPLIIVGKDTRLSCYMLEQALASGVCSQGGEVVLTGPLPTPGVAFVVKSMRADAGVMISASHNSFDDNGIKIFDAQGYKLPDEVELELERMVLNPAQMETKVGELLGNAKRLREVFGRYIVHAKSAFPSSYDLEGTRIVLDCANGAAYRVAPMMFSELGAEVFPVGVAPNGTNINWECGSLYPNLAQDMVRQYRADIGICLDGDADRLVVVDERGSEVDGDKLLALLARLMVDTGAMKKGDTVVGTVMSNLGLEQYLTSLGLVFLRTKVGDRYIIEAMKNSGAILGGEPSGHIILHNHSTTGDGCLAALKIIECMKYYGSSVGQLADEISLFPQVLRNVKVAKKPPLDQVGALQAEVKQVEGKLAGDGRVLLRYSGTEPLARVMVEGKDLKIVEAACTQLADVLGRELGRA